MIRRPDRYYGEEKGSYHLRCISCGAEFKSPVGIGLYCGLCRIGVVNELITRLAPYQDVILDCQKRPSCGQWVPHTFSRFEEAGKRSYKVWYKCCKCGTERLYGLQDTR